MNIYLILTFISTVFFTQSECDSEDFTLGGFRTTQTGPKSLWNETELDKLKKDLLMNYDKYARPEHHNDTTQVRFGLVITHLETNELKSTVTVHVWFRMVWNDKKLRWKESDYGGISVARIAHHEIWQPDLYLLNSALGGEPIFHFGSPNVLLYPNGEVLWVPSAKITAGCKFDLRYWPFDTQHCYLKFCSWTYHGNEIELQLYNNEAFADLEYMTNCSAWDIPNATAEVLTEFYEWSPGPFYFVQFNLTLARRSTTYKAIIVTPAVVIAMLILMQFCLPPQATEKLILSGFISVTLVMFLLYFSTQISPVGSNTPLIVLFYSTSLFLICFSMIATSGIVSYCKIKQNQSLPWAIKKHLQGKLGRLLLLEHNFEEIYINSHTSGKEKAKNNQVSHFGCRNLKKRDKQELILALAMNRIFLIIYGVVFLVIFVVYLF